MTTWESVIKVDVADTAERRAQAIADGLGYAAVLLRDEYGWSAERVSDVLARVIVEVAGPQ